MKTRLSPAHRRILRGYGLKNRTIDAWGCFSADQQDLSNFAKGVREPGIALPVLSPRRRKTQAFIYRPDNPRLMKSNSKVQRPKCEHPAGALNRVHMPRTVQDRLSGQDRRDSRTLVVTEAPIKAEKAAEEGIAIASLWSAFGTGVRSLVMSVFRSRI